MANRRGGDDAEDSITREDGESIPQEHSVVTMPGPEQIPRSASKRRRVERMEDLPFTHDERLAIEEEIITSNTCMRDMQETKKAHDKVWNGQIAKFEATMNDAVDVLKKGTFTISVERIEEMDYELGTVTYYDVETGDEVDSRDMTEDEQQIQMNF